MKLAFLILSTLAFGSVAAAEDQVIIVGTISKLAPVVNARGVHPLHDFIYRG